MKKIALLFALLFAIPCASAQTGYVTVKGSLLKDASGASVASATMTWTPTTTSGTPISFLVDTSLGQATLAAVSTTVTNGGFSLQLADTNLTSPQNVCYNVVVVDNVSGSTLLHYPCVQPSFNTSTPNNWCVGGICNFDLYQPDIAPQVLIQTGPAGQAPTIHVGTVSVGTNAFSAAVTLTQDAVTAFTRDYLMDITLPLAPSATDTTKLPLTGGTVLGSITDASGFIGPLTGHASQDMTLASGESAVSQYGKLYSTPAGGWTSLTGFVSNGVTPTISGGNLVFSGGAQNYNQSLDFNYYTVLPQWTMKTDIIVGPSTSTSVGVGLGIRSAEVNSAFFGVNGFMDMTSNGGTRGTLYITNPTGVILSQSATQLAFADGDKIELTLTRDEDLMTASVYDVTAKSAAITIQYQFGYTNPTAVGSALTPNMGKFALFNFGGTQTVTSFAISSKAMTHADIATVGDSKTACYFAGSWLGCWATELQNNIRAIDLAGGSDQTGDVLNNIPEIIALQPSAVVLNIGRNDICGAHLALSTVETNYASIVSQMQAVGITVLHLLPLYEPTGSCDQTAFSAWISSTFPAASLIDSTMENYSGTASNVLASDNVHPNSFSQSLIYYQVLAALQNQGMKFNFVPYDAVPPIQPPIIAPNAISTSTGPNNLTVQSTLQVGGSANFVAQIPDGDTAGSASFAAEVGNVFKWSTGIIPSLSLSNYCLAFEFATNTCALSSAPTTTGPITVDSGRQLSAAGGLKVANGTNIVFRCTTGGTLPVGALTVTASDCGASVATSLAIN